MTRCLVAVATVVLAAAAEWTAAGYTDIATTSGITGRNVFGGQARKDYIHESTGNGVAVIDFDNDGFDDLFFANGTTLKGPGGKPSQLYRNDGKGHFTDVAAQAGLTRVGWAQAACAGDYDNDGHTDLLVTYYGDNRLYRNRGNGTFEDATVRARLETGNVRYGSGCTFFDYNRDGFLDLYVGNYVDLAIEKTPKPGTGPLCEWMGITVFCGPRGLPMSSNILYRNDGKGGFDNVSEASGILKPGKRYSLGVVSADFDDDGWPDLYVACDGTPSMLFRNKHDGTFEERGVEAGVAYNFDGHTQAGMGIAIADYDGDGRLDIAKTNFSGDLTSLYHNDDGSYFSDVSREAGLGARQLLGWGIAFLDVDDDGWKDLVIANGHVYPEVDGAKLGDKYRQPTILYRNNGNGRFADVTAQAGPAFQVLRASRGLALADVDGDGRQEIAILNMNAAPSLLRTPRVGTGNSLNLRLAGTASNRSAIGARVTVHTGGRRYVDEVMSGNSYYSQHSFTLHFGLGAAAKADRIDIRWPSGARQTVTDVPASARTLRITEQASQ